MKVYVVQAGCIYEGGGVISVHSSRKGANIKAGVVIASSYDSESYRETGSGFYDNGCDFVSVKEMVVEE